MDNYTEENTILQEGPAADKNRAQLSIEARTAQSWERLADMIKKAEQEHLDPEEDRNCQ